MSPSSILGLGGSCLALERVPLKYLAEKGSNLWTARAGDLTPAGRSILVTHSQGSIWTFTEAFAMDASKFR